MDKFPEIVRGNRFGDLFDQLVSNPIVQEVPRVNSLGKQDFFDSFARSSRPFIITNLNKMAIDPLNQIRSSFGDLRINVRLGDYGNPVNYSPERRQLKEMSIADYFSMLQKNSPAANAGPVPTPYAGNFRLPYDDLKKIGADAPNFYDLARFEPPTVWIGAKNSLTPLHRDSSDNFAIQLSGTKRWTIFPPQDAPFLYMTLVPGSPGGDFATSGIDLRSPDLVRFPDFVKAHPISFELHAGEMLYLPMGWSHYVENLELSLMVNYWLSIHPSGIAALDGHSARPV